MITATIEESARPMELNKAIETMRSAFRIDQLHLPPEERQQLEQNARENAERIVAARDKSLQYSCRVRKTDSYTFWQTKNYSDDAADPNAEWDQGIIQYLGADGFTHAIQIDYLSKSICFYPKERKQAVPNVDLWRGLPKAFLALFQAALLTIDKSALITPSDSVNDIESKLAQLQTGKSDIYVLQCSSVSAPPGSQPTAASATLSRTESGKTLATIHYTLDPEPRLISFSLYDLRTGESIVDGTSVELDPSKYVCGFVINENSKIERTRKIYVESIADKSDLPADFQELFPIDYKRIDFRIHDFEQAAEGTAPGENK